MRFGYSVILLLFAGTALSQAPAQPKFLGRIIGVYDDNTGQPIDSAEVRDMKTSSFALTTATGTVSLFFVDTSGSLIRIRKLGYKPVTMFIDNAPDFAPLTITLERIAQELPAVVTVDTARKYAGPGLRGFEERRLSGMGGYFVSEQTLRKEESRTLGNILKMHVPGLNVLQDVRVGARYADIAVSTRSSPPCQVDIFLDGLPVSQRTTAAGNRAIPGGRGRGNPAVGDPAPTTPTNDLKDFLPVNLGGVEYYTAATVPVQFNRTGSGCGVILLWTREK